MIVALTQFVPLSPSLILSSLSPSIDNWMLVVLHPVFLAFNWTKLTSKAISHLKPDYIFLGSALRKGVVWSMKRHRLWDLFIRTSVSVNRQSMLPPFLNVRQFLVAKCSLNVTASNKLIERRILPLDLPSRYTDLWRWKIRSMDGGCVKKSSRETKMRKRRECQSRKVHHVHLAITSRKPSPSRSYCYFIWNRGGKKSCGDKLRQLWQP